MAARATSTAVKPAAAGRPSAQRHTREITAEYVEALRAYSEVLFKGGFCPKGVSRPESVAAIIEVGRDLGLPATQALACVKIVAGRPSIYGDAALALVRASGLLEDFEENYLGEPGTGEYTAVCRSHRVGAKRDRVSRFSIADARVANLWGKAGPWTEYPERMLMWRARGWNLRDEFGDVLCGLITTEEAEDIERPRVVVTTAAGYDVPPTPLIPPTTPALPPGPPSPPEPVPTTPPVRVPVTDDQLERMVELREQMFIGKGIADDGDACDAAWAEVLADYGVESARSLTTGQAAELIQSLGEKYDPFRYPTATAPPSSPETFRLSS